MKLKQLLGTLLLFFLPLAVTAQYSGNVGDYITLPEPTPPGDYKVLTMIYSTNSKYLDVAPGTSRVKILSYFSGSEIVQCDYYCVRQYYVGGQVYQDQKQLVTYYMISCLSDTNTGDGTGGDGKSSDDTDGEGSWFQATTEEGELMLFYKNTLYGEKCAIVTPTKYGGACVAARYGKVTIPEYANGLPVRRIDNVAFKNLEKLTDLVIPSTMQSLDDYSVFQCPNVKTVTCLAETPPKPLGKFGTIFDTSVFFHATLYVPKGCKSKYKEAEGWNKFNTILEIGEVEATTAIDENNFPDANFRKYLLEQSYGKDGFLTTEEIESVLEINVTDYSIKSLAGVEIFTKLRYLYCSNNQLTSLDVSNNTDMLFLECEKNKLTSLDLSNNTQLQAVWCYSNLLTSLDVSNCTSLTKLWCNNNELFSLECSDNSALKELECRENNISYLDLQRNQELMSLSCSDNKLSSLDVSHNVNLKSLYCKSNLLESLNVSNNTKLETLDCYQNKLVSLDVTNNPNLKKLDCSSNKLTSIDVSKNTSLAQLTCSFNQLTSLIVSNTQLTYLNIERNQIEGKAMDNLINSLPTNWSNEEYAFKILSGSDDHEKNSCTTSQVAAVKAKGWTPYYFDMGTNSGWKEYSGSDPTGIRNIKKNVNGDNPIFDISGKRLSQPRKGLLIIDGKKVIVR